MDVFLNRRSLLWAGGTAALTAGSGAEANDAAQGAVRRARTAFGDIAYRAMGTGPATLLLHGFPLNSYQWRDVMALLADVRTCLAPDFMGLGDTEVSETQSLAPADQAAMLAAFLDTQGVASVDIVANDSGAAVAQLFAVRWPERVRSLLLTNGDCEQDCPPAALTPVFALAREQRYAQEWLVPWSGDYALARSESGLGGMCYSEPTHPTDEAIRAYLAPLVQTPTRLARTNRFALALQGNVLAGVEPHLRMLRAPVRVVWGEADTIFSRATPDYFTGLFPHARGVRRLPSAKLFFPEEYPEVIVQEARALWEGG